MSAPKVDVLAWFDDYIRRCGVYDDGTPIRAAVAELIDAANASLQARPGGAQTSANLRLMSALARIGGAA